MHSTKPLASVKFTVIRKLLQIKKHYAMFKLIEQQNFMLV